MRRLIVATISTLVGWSGHAAGGSFAASAETGLGPQTFEVKGVIQAMNDRDRTVVVRHEAITNYMAAMTMPFAARETNELAGLKPGDEISFRLSVTQTNSWIDRIAQTGNHPGMEWKPTTDQHATTVSAARTRHPLWDERFTDERGRAVSLGQFRGQALAITFFFTRCPIPDFCPRLSRNFQEASERLASTPAAPTNWHFLSISFDTEHDTPPVLKAYGERYGYDPAHWSFLTGPADQIDELARLCEVKFERDGDLINHNFRTLIVDAAGHLQRTFPMGGDLSDAIVAEILKAAAVAQ